MGGEVVEKLPQVTLQGDVALKEIRERKLPIATGEYGPFSFFQKSMFVG